MANEQEPSVTGLDQFFDGLEEHIIENTKDKADVLLNEYSGKKIGDIKMHGPIDVDRLGDHLKNVSSLLIEISVTRVKLSEQMEKLGIPPLPSMIRLDDIDLGEAEIFPPNVRGPVEQIKPPLAEPEKPRRGSKPKMSAAEERKKRTGMEKIKENLTDPEAFAHLGDRLNTPLSDIIIGRGTTRIVNALFRSNVKKVRDVLGLEGGLAGLRSVGTKGEGLLVESFYNAGLIPIKFKNAKENVQPELQTAIPKKVMPSGMVVQFVPESEFK